jgi:hypothetical protein
MQYVLDYIAAAILGAALLFIIINANDTAAESHSVYNGDALVQEMLVQTAYLLEGELRNMGVGVPEDQQTILFADTSRLRFLYDLNRDGTPDTVQYYEGTTAEMAGTQNELDRPLYRTVNNSTPLVVGAVTVFRFRYLTRLGEVLTTPVIAARLTEIHSVEITMEVQNPYAMMRSKEQVMGGERNALYSSSLWQQTRLASQNTRR